MQTLTDYLKLSSSIEMPGTYEFYEIPSSFPKEERLFIIKNVLTLKPIFVRNRLNRVEVDPSYRDYNIDNATKLSIVDFFQRLRGLGFSYIEKV